MATERCYACRLEDANVVCLACNEPVQCWDGATAQGKGGRVLEVRLKVKEPLYGAEFEFTASVEDEGIMFAMPFDWHDLDGDCEERNEDAWAALDCGLGFDVREFAVESGIGASAPFGSCYPAVSYAVLPYDSGKCLVERMRSDDGREIAELLQCLNKAVEVSEGIEMS